MDRVLLDTHALLWWRQGDSSLSPRARAAINSAKVLIAGATCWEVGMLVAKRRIALDRDPFVWLRDLAETDGVEIASPAPDTLLFAGLLPLSGFEGDPMDAIIYATARQHGTHLITKDKRIRAFARATRDVTTIW